MAAEYGLDGNAFKNVLLKTVFPQDKPVTMEQLASFCAVAHEYKLNPLVREIFAFPSKSGGIIPIVSIDGWITIVQRHPEYNGHSFMREWKDGKVGTELIATTVLFRRKDRDFPMEHTEFLSECKRDTEPWKKWPSRMLQHKSFIQGARYAFGLSGIYDEDEAQRIIEGERVINMDAPREIQMPQRQQLTGSSVTTFTIPENIIVTNAEPANTYASVIYTTGPADDSQAPATETSEPAGERKTFAGLTDGIPTDPTPELFAENLDADPPEQANASSAEPTIGPGKAKRIHAICSSKKTRSEEDFEKFKSLFKIEHLKDLPERYYKDLEKWANGGTD